MHSLAYLAVLAFSSMYFSTCMYQQSRQWLYISSYTVRKLSAINFNLADFKFQVLMSLPAVYLGNKLCASRMDGQGGCHQQGDSIQLCLLQLQRIKVLNISLTPLPSWLYGFVFRVCLAITPQGVCRTLMRSLSTHCQIDTQLQCMYVSMIHVKG